MWFPRKLDKKQKVLLNYEIVELEKLWQYTKELIDAHVAKGDIKEE